MRKRFATLMLAGLVMVGTVGATDFGQSATSNRCHDKNGQFVEGPGCNPNQCSCLFHEIYEYVRDLF